MICRYFAASGVHALFVKMPFYGERRAKENSAREKMFSRLDSLLAMVTQGVMDVRRGATCPV